MKWLANLFRHLWADETLVVAAQPIVSTIAVLVPNKTVQEVSKAYNYFGVPLVKEIADDPTSIGNAMMNLAVAVLQKKAGNQLAAAQKQIAGLERQLVKAREAIALWEKNGILKSS